MLPTAGPPAHLADSRSAGRGRPLSEPTETWNRLALVVAALVGAGVLGSAAGRSPYAVALGLVGAVLAVLVLRRPVAAALVALFVLYSNAAVVAVNVHGVPGVAARLPVLLLVVPLIRDLLMRRERVQWSPATTWAAVFSLAYLTSAALSPTVSDTSEAVITLLVEGLGLFLVLSNVIRDVAVLRLCLAAVVCAGAFVASLSVLQFVTGNYWRDFLGMAQINDAFVAGSADWLLYADGAVPEGQPRLAGPIGEANFYALVLVVLLPYAIYLFRTSRTLLERLVWAGATTCLLGGVLLTYSRGALLAMTATVVVLALLRVIPRSSLLWLAGVGAAALALVPDLGSRVGELSTALHLNNSSASGQVADAAARGRFSEMVAGLKVFSDYPVLGVGPDQFPAYFQAYAGNVGGGVHVGDGERQAHNLLIGLAAETGIIGLVAFLGLATSIVVPLVVLRRDRSIAPLPTAALASLMLFGCASMFLHMAFLRYMWMHLALAAAVAVVCRRAAEEPAAAAIAVRPRGAVL